MTVLVAAATAAAVTHVLVGLFPAYVDALNGRLTDPLFTLRARDTLRVPRADGLAYVEISDRSLEIVPRPTRHHYARALAGLSDAGAAAAAIDVLFLGAGGEPVDAELAASLQGRMRTYIAVGFDPVAGPDPPPVVPLRGTTLPPWPVQRAGDWSRVPRARDLRAPLDALLGAAAGVGMVNVSPDVDGIHRRIPLVMLAGDAPQPAIVLRMFADAVHVAAADIVVTPGQDILLPRGAIGRTAGDIRIPIDVEGRMRVNFSRAWPDDGPRHLPMERMWAEPRTEDEGVQRRDDVEGKTVLLGEVVTGTDVGATPLEPRMPLAGVHMASLQTMFSGRYLHDLSGRDVLGIEALLLIVLALGGVRLSSAALIALSTSLLVLLVGSAAVGFVYLDRVVPPLQPLLALVLMAGMVLSARYIMEDVERRVLRRSFATYFPASIVDRIVDNPGFVTTGGEVREVTILFSDIQGFTTRSAGLSPGEIQSFLNDYFGEMVAIVFRHEGTVDKFIGDGLMAFFGAPAVQPDHADRAVRAAIEMQRRIEAHGGRWTLGPGTPIKVRIGIHSGVVVVGNMGSPMRLSFTVLGAPVNLAQRLESNAPPGGILISARCRTLLSPSIVTTPGGAIHLKGLDEPIDVFEIPIGDMSANELVDQGGNHAQELVVSDAGGTAGQHGNDGAEHPDRSRGVRAAGADPAGRGRRVG